MAEKITGTTMLMLEISDVRAIGPWEKADTKHSW